MILNAVEPCADGDEDFDHSSERDLAARPLESLGAQRVW
jgi:hypothetical protein